MLTSHLGPETPPSPCSTIPFRRDSDFVDRGALLEQISNKLTAPASRVALVGLGGVGKSQLAIEYCHRAREQSPQTWVFWLHSNNLARLEQGYRHIADTGKIPGRRNPKADIFQLVSSWLREESRGKWIIVLDNADDVALVLRISPYLPQSQNGSVLITTRSRRAALGLVEEGEILQVKPMEGKDAVTLLKKKLGTESISASQAELAAELAAALECMPLAIVQAAAYIKQRAPRYSLQQYLEEFRKSDKRKTSLLNHEAGHLRRDPEAKNSILITWQISFDHIREIRRSAADLLSLMSFFDRQGIPEALLRSESTRGIERGKDKWNAVEVDSDYNNGFEDDIDVLRSYLFISIEGNGMSFEMHRLVQLATRKWLEVHGELEKWKKQFIKSLYAVYPTGEPENWSECQALFPHAKSAEMQQPCDKGTVEQWAIMLRKAAWYAWAKGSYNEAERMSLKATKALLKVVGKENMETLGCMGMLGIAYRYGGRWTEAEELELGVQVMETRKRVLGAEHPSTLLSMVNLASTYRNQGRWKEAEDLEVQVIKTVKTMLSLEHPFTLTSMANLALTYINQGRWKEAEELGVQVIATRKRVLGEEHPDTLTSMGNLASTYRNQGRWKRAEELEVQVMETFKKVLGAEHPSTLLSMDNLASTFRNQGRWKEAEELGVQVMEMSSRVLGEEHPSTLTSMGNLASTYRNEGRWNEAEELDVQVMETRKRVLGEQHPDTLLSMENQASTYRNQGRWKEAEELGVQVIETRKRILGSEHPDTLASMGNLASTYRNKGRWKEAEELEVQVMEASSRVLGEEHPSTLLSMANLASTYRNQGRWKEAEELEVRGASNGDVQDGA
ncbi:TPR-like protein [Lepidopterella palustris CBS 459.81]|uniref:TPR-like protein n=1 Tax=Lepidopterella palustris CBS 459.81 TaxID=1314670 RepID=A0A8E2E517_9PEZI|nr:TPR-like protein [Lepidopterella palustris CBS 459.81]